MQDILDWISRTGLSNIVWITDLDRTVIDHDRHTGMTKSPAGLADVCKELDKKTAGFYIVTGRDLESVDTKIFPGEHLRVSAGYHSVARFEPDDEPINIIPVPDWKIIEARLEALTSVHPKLFLKTMDHYRGLQYFRLPAEEQAAVRDALAGPMQDLVDEMNTKSGMPRLELADSDGGLEIVPAGSSKAPAIDDIMMHAHDRNHRQLVPIYFGDNPGDIDAGRATQARGGVFVAVGNDPEVCAAADFVLPDTATTRALFAKAAGMSNTSAPRPPGLNL